MSSPLRRLPLALRGLRRVAAAAALGALRRRRRGAGAGSRGREPRHGALTRDLWDTMGYHGIAWDA